MTRGEGLRLVREIEAARVLTEIGYRKVQCAACKGDGFARRPGGVSDTCERCEGATWIWMEPAPANAPT